VVSEGEVGGVGEVLQGDHVGHGHLSRIPCARPASQAFNRLARWYFHPTATIIQFLLDQRTSVAKAGQIKTLSESVMQQVAGERNEDAECDFLSSLLAAIGMI
jgi:hypothetical protein